MPTFLGGTNFGAAVDVAAPAGSEDDRPFFDPENPQWPSFEVFRSTNNLIYTTFPLPDAIFSVPPFPPAYDYGFHTLWSGNSFAGPHTCGVAALAAESYQRHRGERPSVATLRQIVIRSADDMVGPLTEDQAVYDPYYREDQHYPCEKIGQDDFYGFGRINAARAIMEAQR
jgi:subtilase family serine protease